MQKQPYRTVDRLPAHGLAKTKATCTHSKNPTQQEQSLLLLLYVAATMDTVSTTMVDTTAQDATLKRRHAEGLYIPPAKRALLSNASQPQRDSWNAQTRIIHGVVNRLNETTIKPLIHELFDQVNLVRMRGVLAKSVLTAALSSPRYAPVYAALVAVVNTKLPEIGELVTHRTILKFRRYYKRKDKNNTVATVVFLGHLFLQAVVHELLLLQILTVLLDGHPTDDSVQVATDLMHVIGATLLQVSPAGVRAVLERLRALLHEGKLCTRVEQAIAKVLEERKQGFTYQIPSELDLVELDNQITFETSLDDEDLESQEQLDVFAEDPNFEQNEATWQAIRAEILGLQSSEDEESETDDSEEEQEPPLATESAMVPAEPKTVQIHDLTEADLVHLRRQIYLTIMSSATFEECTHKLAKIDIPEGREEEMINMLIECCSQERTFLRYYGLIASRLCFLHHRWRDAFMEAFVRQYFSIHRLETNKLRNVAKLFAHLLHTDSIRWSVLSVIRLNEEDTNSSSRIFIKILMQEMAEAMGMARLKERFETTDPEVSEWFKGLFPRDNIRHVRYSINFFTAIGLGPLTDGMREFLKNAPKMIMEVAKPMASDSSSDSSSVLSSASSVSSSSYSSRTSSSSSYSSGDHGRQRSPSFSSSSGSSDSSSYSSRSRSPRRPRSPSESSSSNRTGSRSASRDSRPTPSVDSFGRDRKQHSKSLIPEGNRSRSPSYSRSRSPSR